MLEEKKWISTNAKFLAENIFNSELGLNFSPIEIIKIIINGDSFFKRLLQLPIQRCYIAMILVDQCVDMMHKTQGILQDIAIVQEEIKFNTPKPPEEENSASSPLPYAKELTKLNDETATLLNENTELLSQYQLITTEILHYNKQVITEWSLLQNKSSDSMQQLLAKTIDPVLRNKINELKQKAIKLHQKLKANLLSATKIIHQESVYANRLAQEIDNSTEYLPEIPRIGKT